MSARKARRAAEHKARKLARKAEKERLNSTHPPVNSPAPLPAPIDIPEPVGALDSQEAAAPPEEPTELVEEVEEESTAPEESAAEETNRATSQKQIDANRANARHSTGPRTSAGKAISSQNRLRHGLAGKFHLMPFEDEQEFSAMRAELYDHYRPADVVEIGYVDRLAEHTWLRSRAMDLQVDCYDEEQTGFVEHEQQFAVLSRYENQHERAMDRCVNQLLKLQTARRKEQSGFESEIRKEAAETRKKEAHEAKMRLLKVRAKLVETDADIRETLNAPMPGHVRVPFEEISAAFRGAIRQVSEEIAENEDAA